MNANSGKGCDKPRCTNLLRRPAPRGNCNKFSRAHQRFQQQLPISCSQATAKRRHPGLCGCGAYRGCTERWSRTWLKSTSGNGYSPNVLDFEHPYPIKVARLDCSFSEVRLTIRGALKRPVDLLGPPRPSRRCSTVSWRTRRLLQLASLMATDICISRK